MNENRSRNVWLRDSWHSIAETEELLLNLNPKKYDLEENNPSTIGDSIYFYCL